MARGRGGHSGAQWLIDELSARGVAYLFGNPGSTELPLTEAIARVQRPRYVLGLHEGAVMGMADGYAQARGAVAVANVHVQPGLANAMAGILNACRARVPLVVTVGQQVRHLLPSGPFLGGEVVQMAQPLAKGAWEVERAADLPAAFDHAWRVAMAPPRGPVVLSLPLDVQAGPVGDGPLPSADPVAHTAPPPSPQLVVHLAATLDRARAPVLVVGDEVAVAGAGDRVSALAARLGAPIFGEPMGARQPVPSDDPRWRGPLPPFAAQIAPLLGPHDVVLALGMPVFRLFGDSPGAALGPDTTLLHIDTDPEEVGRSHPAQVGAVADVAATVDALLQRCAPAEPAIAVRDARVRADAAQARRHARRTAWVSGQPRPGRPTTPAGFARAVAATLGPHDVVVDEGLTSTRALRALMGRRRADTWFAHRGSALGWGLPAAVGVALAWPERRVVALQGDGGLVFGAPALWTAARLGLRLALVVADNGGYEILKAGMHGLTGARHDSWPGLDLAGPGLDVVALCRGFGVPAQRVDDGTDVPQALRELWARTTDGPAVLVVAVAGPTAPVGWPVAAG